MASYKDDCVKGCNFVVKSLLYTINPLLTILSFNDPAGKEHLKTLREKEELLGNSIFSFSYNSFQRLFIFSVIKPLPLNTTFWCTKDI